MNATFRNIAAASCCIMAMSFSDGGIDERIEEVFSRTPAGKLLPDTATILFLGDVMMHRAQLEAGHRRYVRSGGTASPDCHQAYDFGPCLEEIQDRIEGADVTVANMEFTLAGAPFTGYPAFSAPDSYALCCAESGIDVFLTANNHIYDKGQAGLGRTLEIYSEMEQTHGIKFTGSCEIGRGSCGPLYFRARGIKVAIVNFTYGTNCGGGSRYKTQKQNRAEILAMLRQAREEGADFIIAAPHWGEEYVLRHSAAQASVAQWLAAGGADLIIGTHPHVVQDCDTVRIETPEGEKAVPVLYSLGNIISNMSAANTQLGLMAEVRLEKAPDGTVRLLGTDLEFTWCVLPGSFTDCHKTVPVKKYLGAGSGWNKMINTYYHVKKTTGIKD